MANHVVAISFGQIVSSSSASVTPKIKHAIKKSTGFSWDLITATSNQDCAAEGVAKALNFEVEPCTMHQSDKIGESCTGGLVRTRNKVPINPFPEGLRNMQKCRDQTKFISSSLTNRMDYLDFKIICKGFIHIYIHIYCP